MPASSKPSNPMRAKQTGATTRLEDRSSSGYWIRQSDLAWSRRSSAGRPAEPPGARCGRKRQAPWRSRKWNGGGPPIPDTTPGHEHSADTARSALLRQNDDPVPAIHSRFQASSQGRVWACGSHFHSDEGRSRSSIPAFGCHERKTAASGHPPLHLTSPQRLACLAFVSSDRSLPKRRWY